MRRTHRKDAIQDDMVNYLRSSGVSVEIIGKPVDLLIGYMGQSWPCELKSGHKGYAKKLNEKQQKFKDSWKGEVLTFHSVQDAMDWRSEVLKSKGKPMNKNEFLFLVDLLATFNQSLTEIGNSHIIGLSEDIFGPTIRKIEDRIDKVVNYPITRHDAFINALISGETAQQILKSYEGSPLEKGIKEKLPLEISEVIKTPPNTNA